MKINTKHFGIKDINEDEIVTFPIGIYGFEDFKRYIFLPFFDENDDSMLSVQSVDNEDLAFVAMNPFNILADYSPVLAEDILAAFEVSFWHELSFYVLAVIPENFLETTVDLVCPLAINSISNIGFQVPIENEIYSVKYPAFPGIQPTPEVED